MIPVVPVLLAATLAFGTSPAPIAIAGAVNKPGEATIEKPMRLKAFIQQSGGLRKDADAKKIKICSADGKSRIVDLTRLDQVVDVRPGDRVTVPEIKPSDYVFVTGQVQVPGAVEYRAGLDVLSVVNGAIPISGIGTDVRVLRTENGKVASYPIDLDKVQKGLQANMNLMPADKVVVNMRPQASDRELLTIVVIGLLILLIVTR